MQNVKPFSKSIDKTAVLYQIRSAKSAHMRWRAYAQALIAGVGVSEEKVPVRHTECTFGHWYHGQGRALLGHLSTYKGVGTPHEMLHAVYERIYHLVQGEDPEEKGGALSKLFTSKASQERKRHALLLESMEELIGISDTLLKVLDLLEEEVRETL